MKDIPYCPCSETKWSFPSSVCKIEMLCRCSARMFSWDAVVRVTCTVNVISICSDGRRKPYDASMTVSYLVRKNACEGALS